MWDLMGDLVGDRSLFCENCKWWCSKKEVGREGKLCAPELEWKESRRGVLPLAHTGHGGSMQLLKGSKGKS